MQENFTSPILDRYRVISIALLNQHINIDSLKALSLRLKQRFAYFEILLLNPILVPQHNIQKAKKECITPPPRKHKFK